MSEGTRSTLTRSKVITVPTWARNLPPDFIPPAAALDSTNSDLTLPPTALLVNAQEKDTSWWSFTLPHRNHHRAHTAPDPNEKQSHRDDDQEDRNSRHSRISDYFGDIMAGSRRSSRAGSLSHSHFRGNTRDDRGDRNSVANITQAHFSQNQAQTPGWSSPWQPFRRKTTHRPDPFLLMTTLPHQSRKTRARIFFLESPFAPLILRIINLIFVVSTLGLAASIMRQETANGIRGVVGSSIIFCLSIAPIAVLHIGVVLYLEYFGKPIGLWSIQTKLWFTLAELFFISLWSSILSLSFDNLFHSALSCTDFAPYERYDNLPDRIIELSTGGEGGDFLNEICQKQVALISLVACSLCLAAGVLIVSLFRIFDKVARNL